VARLDDIFQLCPPYHIYVFYIHAPNDDIYFNKRVARLDHVDLVPRKHDDCVEQHWDGGGVSYQVGKTELLLSGCHSLIVFDA
jgi:hypothetical protein